jgi:hypothetical protein
MDQRQRSWVLWIRLTVIAGFLALMPVLAMPAVSRSVDDLLYDHPLERAVSQVPIEAGGGSEEHSSLETSGAPVVKMGGSTTAGRLLEWKLAALSVERVRIDEIQQRLKKLGASYLLLEQLEGEAEPYHFRCVMPVPGSGVYGRPFDATENEALLAMERVLTAVERWCAETGHIRSASPDTAPRGPVR